MIKLKELLIETEYKYPLATGTDLHSYEGMEGWKGKLVTMTPDKFLKLALPLTANMENDKSLQNIEYRIKNNLPLDPLVLSVNMDERHVVGHEGRHRATVSRKLGIKEVPVLIYTGSGFKRVPKWDANDHETVDKAEFSPEK